MTDVEQRLREIEERTNAAPKGPWLNHHGEFVSQAGTYMAICRVNRPVVDDYRRGITVDGWPGSEQPLKEFIAHAREDVPWLLALLREREEENRRLRQIIADVRRLVETMEPDNPEAQLQAGNAYIGIEVGF